MLRPSNSSRSFRLTILALTFSVNLAAAWLSHLRWNALGVDLFRSVWGILSAAYLGMIVVCLWLFILVARPGRSQSEVSSHFKFFQSDHLKVRALGWITFLAVMFLIPYVKFTFQVGRSAGNPFMVDATLLSIFYYWLCWYALLLAMLALKVALKTSWQVGFVSALVLLGVVYEVLIRFNAVTAYPLSMGWSEGSRYYYASLYFSRWIYGESTPLPTLHPSRYLLQSIPFLIPGLSVTAHRFWQFLLWMGLTAAATIILANRTFSPLERAAKWLFAGWAFLFLMRVGVYYHLQVMVILPLLFITKKRPWQSLSAVVLASLWAGISRVNWFPVPALIATAIYLLETPLKSTGVDAKSVTFKQITNYLAQPIVWVTVGLLSALTAQAAYIFLSGNAGNVDAFASSFVSDLLWYRLWPNANHFLGILPAILIVSGPLLITIALAARRWEVLHTLRWFGLFLMIGILFAGSLVVSVKIGGGGDLHNMDAYAILLAIITAYFVGGRVQVEPGEAQVKIRSWPTLAVAVLIPILFLIWLLSPYPKYNEDRNEMAYQQLLQAVDEVGKEGPILFINERQLVTFGDADVPLVADYEAVTLMEMAMSNNQAYLKRFYGDLQNHRFAAIVAAKQNLVIKQTGPTMEENNAWNSRVSPYLLCYYHPVLTVEPQGNRIEVYVPTIEATQCP
ncbi:MAG: hypothetical protein EHM33_03190 [Chloroflexi bacterium]|nr:MAG: hypothetical protein EHM33_03190 [Chloroflexota bacterium]